MFDDIGLMSLIRLDIAVFMERFIGLSLFFNGQQKMAYFSLLQRCILILLFYFISSQRECYIRGTSHGDIT